MRHLRDVVFEAVHKATAVDDNGIAGIRAVNQRPDCIWGLRPEEFPIVVRVEGNVVGARFRDGLELLEPRIVTELNERHSLSPFQ